MSFSLNAKLQKQFLFAHFRDFHFINRYLTSAMSSKTNLTPKYLPNSTVPVNTNVSNSAISPPRGSESSDQALTASIHNKPTSTSSLTSSTTITTAIPQTELYRQSSNSRFDSFGLSSLRLGPIAQKKNLFNSHNTPSTAPSTSPPCPWSEERGRDGQLIRDNGPRSHSSSPSMCSPSFQARSRNREKSDCGLTSTGSSTSSDSDPDPDSDSDPLLAPEIVHETAFSEYDFDQVDITTMTMICPINGEVEPVPLALWMRVTRVESSNWASKTARVKVIHPGFAGALRSVGYRDIVSGARASSGKAFKNSICVDVSCQDKMVNCKISSHIQMVGLKDVSQAGEATFYIIQNIYEAQRLINKSMLDIDRTARTFAWVIEHTRSGCNKITAPSEYSQRIYPGMWIDRCNRILAAPPCTSLMSQLAGGCTDLMVGSVIVPNLPGVAKLLIVPPDEIPEELYAVNSAGNRTAPLPKTCYPEELDPELADVLIEKSYDHTSHDRYCEILRSMFDIVNYCGVDLEIYRSKYKAVLPNIDLDTIQFISLPTIGNTEPKSEIRILTPSSASSDKTYSIPSRTALQQFISDSTISNLVNTPLEDFRLFLISGGNNLKGIDRYIEFCRHVDSIAYYISHQDPDLQYNYSRIIQQIQRTGITFTRHAQSATSTSNRLGQCLYSGHYFYQLHRRANREYYSLEELAKIGFDVEAIELKPLRFERAMITYNYNLGFSLLKFKLVQMLEHHSEMKIEYDNANGSGVHIYIPVEIPRILANEIRKKKDRNHSFIINAAGSVTQSGPHEDMNRQAYIHLKYLLTQYRESITSKNEIVTRRKGPKLTSAQVEDEKQSKLKRVAMRRERRSDKYQSCSLTMPIWYLNTCYTLESEIRGDSELDCMTASTSTTLSVTFDLGEDDLATGAPCERRRVIPRSQRGRSTSTTSRKSTLTNRPVQFISLSQSHGAGRR